MKLTKLSDPGWERDFDSIEDLYVVLRNSVCLICREETDDMSPVWSVTTDDKIGDLLTTCCACEYWIDV